MKELQTIQQKLEAPKGQYNNFGKYKYRSCEDILSAVKPLLADCDAVLTITDDIIKLGDRYYVKATATLKTKSDSLSVSAFAREAETKKGMDESQITGAASSYARKYALNGLFAIDDTKDADDKRHGMDKTPEPSNYVTETQSTEIEAMAKETGSDIDKFLLFAGAKSFETIPAENYKKCIDTLKVKHEMNRNNCKLNVNI